MKKFFKEAIYWTLFPMLIVVATIVTNYFTQSFVLQMAAGFVVLCVYGIIRDTVYCNDDERSETNGEHGVIIGDVTVTVWTILLFQQNVQLHPWGVTGWFIFLALTIILISIFVSRELENHQLFEILNSRLIYLKVFFSIYLFSTIAEIYLFWGTQYVWVPIIMTVILTMTSKTGLDRWLKDKRGKLENEPFFFMVSIVVASLVSTIIQFSGPIGNFFSSIFSWGFKVHIMYGMSLWACIGITIALFVIVFIFKKIKVFVKKRNAKKEEIKSAKQKAIVKQKELLKKQEDDLIRVSENKAKAKSIYDQLLGSKDLKTTWKDLRFMESCGVYFPDSWALKADFVTLLSVSNIKQKITFNSDLLEFAAKKMDNILSEQNDELIQQVIDQIKEAEKFSDYEGYEALVSKLHKSRCYPMIQRLVKLKDPAEKENV